ncbi:MAG TPA: OmpA family protein [Flavobacteriales bacterium]|nr:OmpA family protein [Flavobacteriales bacterium]
MKKLNLYITSALLLSTFTLGAQLKDVPFEKDFFKDKKDEFKEARSQFNDGKDKFDEAMKAEEEGYSGYKFFQEAIPLFEKAEDFNPNYSILNYMLGYCYLQTEKKFKALEFLLKARELNGTVSPNIDYHVAQAYHLKYQWDKAIENYQKFNANIKNLKGIKPEDMQYLSSDVIKRIEQCKYGKKYMEKPERVWIDNLGDKVNSKFPEYAPFISADESVLIFTGRRDDTQGGEQDPGDGKFYEDAYIARRNAKGEWEKSLNMGELINHKTHDAPAGLSPDGKKLFVFYGWKGGGDIYTSEFVNGQYTEPKSSGSNICTKAYESSASISFDGKELYFAANREGGFGEEDIYMSKWDEKKKEWGPATNLGNVVNTKERETGVFLHPDGEHLYFASQGHTTMGGFDLFCSVKVNGAWTTPTNLGYPINSPDNDVFFVVSGSGRYGYYASFREEGMGETDIYRITFLGPEKPPMTNAEDNLLASIAEPVKQVVIEPKVEIKTSNLAILRGTIRDAKTLEPLEAKIELMNNETNELVASFMSDSKGGTYLVTLPSGKNYGIAVKKDGYLFHSENIDLPASAGYKEYQKDVLLKKVEVGQAIVLRNIFFDYDKATLRPASTAELERLTKLLQENPTIRIEISGHTDSQGDNAYNKKLSGNRASAVVDYLVTKGIPAARLEFAGYGEEKLMVSDAEILKMKTKSEKEEAHQQNRRTEFKILSK